MTDEFSKADLEVDNRTLRRQLKNITARLAEEVELKLVSFDICRSGFQVKELLDVRAKAMIDGKKSGSKKQKAKDILSPDTIPYPELYNTLRSFRYEKSMELGIPAYMIFSQKVLIELVNYLPIESATLQLINGLGARKIESYGADIIQIIQHYCDENGVERMEIPLKEVSKKEKKPKVDTKKVSFELYQSGKSIAEIAKERALTANTIESHLAHYVRLGELDVALFLDEAKLKKITQYFETTENKSFGAAKAQFGDEVSYGELRMGLSYWEKEKPGDNL